ncbi:unnamed protein product [marine sediment metagenome]|uniref:Cupin type-2 domain-containing protein n=1 Tax=marine sediment metagenome TaxID=412755 RepID=X1GCN0_9ZZZZ
MQVLLGPEDGVTNFVMRRFVLDPGAATPHHTHDWEHEVLILEGEGVVVSADDEHPVRPGNVVYVPPAEVHQFRNTGSGTFAMLCLVPMKGHA